VEIEEMEEVLDLLVEELEAAVEVEEEKETLTQNHLAGEINFY
jgi:lipoate-protein ligase A